MAARCIAVVALGALLYACAPTQTPCAQQTDCAGNQTCLPIGTCASACTTSADCGGGEKCSAAGGCVLVTGCGSDVDCSTTQVCESGGACVDNCLFSGCADGMVCLGNGHCVDPDADGGSKTCGGQLFEATRVEANFLIVLDHSGSMMETVSGTAKWTSAVQAIRTLTAQHENQIRFGLQLFSFSQAACLPGKIDVPIGSGNAAAISSALPSNADGRNTPIAGALQVAATASGLNDPTRSNNVLLITDGKENCNADPVARVKDLFADGIKTYVVGFGGSVSGSNLSEMAVEGGTALGGTPKYYQADDPAALATALSQVAMGAIGCALQLKDTPPDASSITVVVNGKAQPRDPARQNGWEYDAQGNRITLYGQSCAAVSQDANAKVQIVYGCPDDFIDGAGDKGDGGTAPPDGGVEIN